MAIDYYEDAPSVSGKIGGTVAFGVRQDTPAANGGTDGDYVALRTDTYNALRVTEDGGAPTYDGVAVALAPASTATDIAELVGSATKTVVVDEVRVSGVATAAVLVNCQLVRRSTADTLGTSTTPTIAKRNSANAAATAVLKAYTVNPTLGTSAGVVAARKLTVGKADASGLVPVELVFNLKGYNGGQGLRLSGVAQTLALNLNGETVGSGGSLNVAFTFRELPTTA